MPYYLRRRELLRVGLERLRAAAGDSAGGSQVGGFLRVVRDPDQVEVLGGHHALLQRLFAQPGQQARPVRAAEQDDREVLDLARLRERQRLEQLVERAVTAREDHEAL